MYGYIEKLCRSLQGYKTLLHIQGYNADRIEQLLFVAQEN